MKYDERFAKFPNTLIISYPFRWGGQLKDRWMWMGEINGEVFDYAAKDDLIARAVEKNLPYVVLRIHRNFTATNIACSGQVAGAGNTDGDSTSAASDGKL